MSSPVESKPLTRRREVAKKTLRKNRCAFSLIELLIVVSIISILATIAIPNYLVAQIRAKVARARGDMRTIAGMLEVYCVDTNKYPPPYVGLSGTALSGPSVFFPSNTSSISGRLIRLTTPIGYLTNVPRDPFTLPNGVPTATNNDLCDTFDYFTDIDPNGGKARSCGARWRLTSAGPDLLSCYGGSTLQRGASAPENVGGCAYDPTNGATSAGDVVRVGAPSDIGDEPFYNRAANPAI